MERNYNLDILRIISTIAVVLLHISAQNYYNIDVVSDEFEIFAITNGMVRWCVPVFLMISGALFLGEKCLYKKYIINIYYVYLLS